MLKIEKVENFKTWFISLDGEELHWPLTESTAVVWFERYKKAYDSGYKAAKDEENKDNA